MPDRTEKMTQQQQQQQQKQQQHKQALNEHDLASSLTVAAAT